MYNSDGGLATVMYCEVCFCLQVQCLQTFEHMSALWAFKALVFLKFQIQVCLRYKEKHRNTFLLAVGMCFLQTSNSVVNINVG